MNKFKSLIIAFSVVFVMSAGFNSSYITAQGNSGSKDKKTTQKSENVWFNADTVKAGDYDTGTMWTFEYAPKDYLSKKYNFTATDEWLEKVRMSALRFATYCTASFVSEDGLVMTNDHCSRDNITAVSKPGENLQENSFFAKSLEEERKVPGLFVDQLVYFADVTKEIQDSSAKVSDDQKPATIKRVADLIKNREKAAKKLDKVQITSLYNGGKYSLYGYKTYNDVRLVFSPETDIAFYGGDPDNFTYPRYDFDCTFYRVYDTDGKPLKTKNFYKWSTDGAAENELVFVVGNPGSTSRLQTTAQLAFVRDVQYPRTLELLSQLMSMYDGLIKENPANKEELQNTYFGLSNSYKAISGQLKGLRDPYLFARKVAWENKFKAAVNKDANLRALYGDLWDKIAASREELKGIADESYAIGTGNKFVSGEYFAMAQQLIDLAKDLQLPEADRKPGNKGENLKTAAETIFPADMNMKIEKQKVAMQVDKLNKYLDKNLGYVKDFTQGKSGIDAAESILKASKLNSKESIQELISKGADGILKSGDPFINFLLSTEARRMEIQKQSKDINGREVVYSQAIGKALFEVYGTKLPPDATFTLRISDGIVKGYEYNGTIAPPFTTFYGLYEKYNSFNKEYPYSLPKNWQNPPADFNLATKFNYVTTNDIIGGNSGSAMINKKGEVVGLVFDGNIESLPGSFIYTPDANRTVAVHSNGLLEAIKHIYKATRLSDELSAGKIK
ncbi:MAG: S46 family peptidase [Bacteroidota bacterium]|nr:S46 family peptidase [Bacteroidota bacterium]